MTSAQVKQSPRLALFTAFFFLANCTPTSTAAELFETLMRLLYDLSFPFSIYVPGSTMFPWDTFKYLRRFWTYNADKLTVQLPTAYVVAGLVVCNLLYMVYLVMFYLDKRSTSRPNVILYRIMNTHVFWSSGPLLIPYTSIMFEYIMCNERDVNCNTIAVHPVEFTFFMVLIVAQNLLALVHKVSVFDWSPFSSLPAAKIHSRVCLIATPVRSAITILFGLLSESRNREVSYLLVILCIVYQTVLSATFWYEQPFHKRLTNQLFVWIYATAGMASLSVLFAIATEGSGDVVCVGLFAFGTLMLVPAVISVSRWRLQLVEGAQLGALRRATDVELRIRCEMEKLVRVKQAREQGEVEGKGIDTREIDALFATFSGQLRNSFKVNLLWASYVFIFKNNKFLAMQRIRQILDHSPMLFDIMPMQIRIRVFAELSSGEEIDAGLVSFEEQQRLQRFTMACMSNTIALQVHFWGALLSDEYTLQSLERLTAQILDQSEAARTSLQRMIALNPKSALYRRLYSQFLLNVVNDEIGAKRQLKRAQDLDQETDATVSLTDARNCIMVVSGEKRELGVILEANDQTCQVFQISYEDIVGKKLSFLMARCFVSVHNGFLLRYIDSKTTTTNTNQYRKAMLMKTVTGFLFEADLQVREYANFTLEPSIAFFGLIMPLPLRMFSIVHKRDLIIWDISRTYFQFFNSDMQKLRNLELSICTDVPCFKAKKGEIAAAVADGQSWSCEIEYEHAEMKQTIVLTVTEVQYASDFYHVLLKTQEEVKRSSLDRDRMSEGDSTDVDENAYNDKDDDETEDEEHGGQPSRKVRLGVSIPSTPEVNTSESESDRSEDSDKGPVRSSTSSAKSGNLLRMGLARANTTIETSLRHLLLWILCLQLVLAIMGVSVEVLWSGLTVGRYDATLDILSAPVQTGTQTAIYSAYLFQHLINGTLFDTPEAREKEELRLRRDLSHFVEHLDEFRARLFTYTDRLSLAERMALSNAKVDLVNYDGVELPLSVIETVHQYSVAMSMILNKNLTDLAQDPRPLNFLLSNRRSNITATWDALCKTVLDNQDSNSKDVQRIEFAFMLAAVLLVVVVICAVILPAIFTHCNETTSVYRLFEQIEVGNLRDLYSQCLQRLADLEGGSDQLSNNIELQDLMEVIASKRQSSSAILNRASKLNVDVYRVLTHDASRRFSLILFFTLVYFVGYYVWWVNLYHHLFESIDYRVYYGVMRTYYTRSLTFNALQYNNDTAEFTMDLDHSRDLELVAWKIEHALYYGHPDLNIRSDIRSMDGGVEILTEPLCKQAEKMIDAMEHSDYLRPLIGECPTEFNGVLSRSTHEANVAFATLLQDVRRLMLTDRQSFTPLLPKLLALKHLADDYLPLANEYLNLFLRESFTAGFVQAYSVRQGGTAAYILLFICLFVLVYVPLIRAMNKTLRQTRNLLMIIPADIVDGSKTLRDMMRIIALKMIQSQ
jgi:hypothetical protein